MDVLDPAVKSPDAWFLRAHCLFNVVWGSIVFPSSTLHSQKLSASSRSFAEPFRAPFPPPPPLSSLPSHLRCATAN